MFQPYVPPAGSCGCGKCAMPRPMSSGQAQKINPLLFRLAFNFHEPAKKSNCEPRKNHPHPAFTRRKRAGMNAGVNSIRTVRYFLSENNGCRTTTAAVCAARLAGIVPAGGVLAAELDAARRADGLPVLPAVAGLYPRGGRAGLAGAPARRCGRARAGDSSCSSSCPCRRGGCLKSSIGGRATGNISAPARSRRSNTTRSARCRFPPSCRRCLKPRNWCGLSAGSNRFRPAARDSGHARGSGLGLLFAGLVMLALTLAWPKFFYPFVWISLVFIFEPVNRRLGRPHFLEWLQHGDWRPVISLSLGALICGFFWEMWNYWSWPQWIYHTPGANYPACLRNAAAGLRRIHPFCAGIVRAEKSSLGARAEAGALKRNFQMLALPD